MPKLAVGGEHQDHLVRPMLQVNHTVQGFPAVNSLFFTFRPGEISVEINHDQRSLTREGAPSPRDQSVTCHRRPFPGSIFADDNTLYVILRGLQYMQSTCR